MMRAGKKKDGAKTVPSLSNNHNGLFVASVVVVAVVAVVCFLITSFQEEAVDVDPGNFHMTEPLARVVACATACRKEVDPEDTKLLEGLKGVDPGLASDLDVTTVCLLRCREHEKETTEVGYVTMPPSKPPADVQEYLQCAIECSPGVPMDLSDGHAAVLSRLHRCGVVHLHNLFPVLLLKEMSEAVEQLRGGQYASMGYDDLHDVATLRGGLSSS